jgi:mannose-6-phosphate isomerase
LIDFSAKGEIAANQEYRVMKLPTHYIEKPWGRTDLPAVFAQAANRQIGEVWFDAADAPLPVLVKWLFTSEKLSIQVHPNDDQARKLGEVGGKEEMWFIVSAEPGACLGIGTKHALSADELRAAALSGTIEDLMDWKPVQAGDYYYIPAGTVHAIGGGITLIEVQQNADITYRLYDYGRPRELHLDQGVAVSDARPYADPRAGHVDDADMQQLVDGPYFQLWYAKGEAISGLLANSAVRWIIPMAGSISVSGASAAAGECLYLQGDQPVSASADAVALVAASVT